MIEYQINLTAVATFEDFVASFNTGMIESVGGHWNGNLDAFNDYLFWPEPHPYRMVLVGWDHCAEILSQIEGWGGRSVVTILKEIFADNPQTRSFSHSFN